jgi:hypothetical protein
MGKWTSAVVDVTGYQTVELVLRPVLRDEGRRENHEAKAASCDAVVNLSLKTVTEPQLELVVPDA